MKKKQVALLLAALMCITPVAESAAVMGAEFSSGEETVEMQGTEEEAEAEDTAEIWTSGEEVSDFGTDEAPEVDVFTSEESEASTDAAGAKQVKGSFEVAYITEEQYNNALQNEERPEVDMKTVEVIRRLDGSASRIAGIFINIDAEKKEKKDRDADK